MQAKIIAPVSGHGIIYCMEEYFFRKLYNKKADVEYGYWEIDW